MNKIVRTVLALCISFSLPVALADDWDQLLGFSDSKQSTNQQQNATGRNTANQRTNNPRDLQVVKRLDQEILLLRAERSQRNGDVNQVRRYVEQLEKQQILPPFMGRVKLLKQYVAQHSQDRVTSSKYMQQIAFPMDDENAVVAIVLPTTGDYQQAGESLLQAIQKGLEQAGFRGKLVALDSNLYANAFDLWELLKYYEPDFIFGPLTKEKVADWKQLRTGVSTLFFNDLPFLGVNEFSLSPNKMAGLEQVFQVLQNQAVEKIVLLTDASDKSQELGVAFKEAWLSIHGESSITTQVIDGNVGKNINQIMGIEQSSNRSRWLRSILNQPLEHEKRRRQDTQAVVSLVPQSLAIQIAPYLRFIANNTPLMHVWYPSKSPSAQFLDFNRDAWQQTVAILPQNIQINSLQNRSQIDLTSKDGLFYALGRVAVEIVKNPTPSNTIDSVEFTAFGSYVRNASGQFHLLPVVYWADRGIFKPYDDEWLPK